MRWKEDRDKEIKLKEKVTNLISDTIRKEERQRENGERREKRMKEKPSVCLLLHFFLPLFPYANKFVVAFQHL